MWCSGRSGVWTQHRIAVGGGCIDLQYQPCSACTPPTGAALLGAAALCLGDWLQAATPQCCLQGAVLQCRTHRGKGVQYRKSTQKCESGLDIAKAVSPHTACALIQAHARSMRNVGSHGRGDTVRSPVPATRVGGKLSLGALKHRAAYSVLRPIRRLAHFSAVAVTLGSRAWHRIVVGVRIQDTHSWQAAIKLANC